MFSKFQKFPSSPRDSGNLWNFENTSEIETLILLCPMRLHVLIRRQNFSS
jgi:hypothetical protein